MTESINWSQEIARQEQAWHQQRQRVASLRAELQAAEQTLWQMEGALTVLRRIAQAAPSPGSPASLTAIGQAPATPPQDIPEGSANAPDHSDTALNPA